MNERKLTLAISPHIATKEDVPKVMATVIIALIPALLWGIYLFRLPAVIITITCIFGSLSGEMFIQMMRKRDIWIIKDYSAVLTGLLLAMVLPPSLPWWMALLGSWFAIIIGKGLFGGLGFNIFNPALLGRAFLQMSFPVAMTTWITPKFYAVTSASVTSATPLALGKFDKTFANPYDLFFGLHGGCIGETSAFLLLLGAAILIFRKIIDVRIPFSMLGTMALCAFLFQFIPGVVPGSILYHLFAGGAILGAFFMTTDLTTSPITPLGKIIFGCGIGAVVMLIRVFGGLPEAVMFSILFMNAFVPLINRHTRPKIFGTTTKKAKT